jgi:hypothetical protein
MSRQAGYKAIRRCSIDVVDGCVDPDIATVLYRRGTRPRANQKRAQQEVSRLAHDVAPVAVVAVSYDEARRRREAAEASMAELKEAELRGELVRRAAVEREMASRLVALRETLEALADRLSALVAAESDAQACRRLLRDEHRNALAAFSAAGNLNEEEEVANGGS